MSEKPSGQPLVFGDLANVEPVAYFIGVSVVAGEGHGGEFRVGDLLFEG